MQRFSVRRDMWEPLLPFDTRRISCSLAVVPERMLSDTADNDTHALVVM